MFFCRVCKAFLRIWPGKLFSVVAPGQSPRHTRRHEQRTWLHPDGNPGNADTDDDPQRRRPVRLAALAAAATTVANCRPVRDFLLFLRDDANAYNRDRVLRVGQDEVGWCLSAEGRGLTAPRGHPSRCARAGRGSRWLALRLVWGFMVCAAPPGGESAAAERGRQLEHCDLTLGADSFMPQRQRRRVSVSRRGFSWRRRLSPWPSARCC